MDTIFGTDEAYLEFVRTIVGGETEQHNTVDSITEQYISVQFSTGQNNTILYRSAGLPHSKKQSFIFKLPAFF